MARYGTPKFTEEYCAQVRGRYLLAVAKMKMRKEKMAKSKGKTKTKKQR
jgi:hypothetical protein